MSFDYAKMLTVSNNLMDSFGTTITHVVVNEGAYDTATQTVTTSNVSNSVIAVVINFTDAEIATGNIDSTDIKVLIKAGIKPNINDQLIINTKTYYVKSVKTLQPVGTDLLYTVVAGQ